ncbi:MAG: transposase [Planctomycetes bacterium]|nr:transposase [Planctomycetota bacterium]
MLRMVQGLIDGHFSTCHRVFSRAAWSLWPLGRMLAQAVLRWTDPDQPVIVAMDDTTAQHKGRHVYGKGCHHDAVRSSHKHIVWRWGHKWVVLAISVKFPFTWRRWALPVLAALYRPAELNRVEGRRHKTPAELARQLVAVLIHWFPGRKFIVLGDGGYSAPGQRRVCLQDGRRAGSLQTSI